MLRFKRLLAVLLTVALLGPMLPLQARTKKGDKFLAQGRAREERREWDAALDLYEKALSEDPGDLVYQTATQKARFEASAMHITNATKIRSEGRLGDALLEFQKAYALNPSAPVGEQEILRTQEMIGRERQRVMETGRETAPELRGLTPSEQAKKDLSDKIDRMLPIPELEPLKPSLIDFTIVNQTPRVLFETVTKYAGLNVLWDPDYQPSLPPGKDRLTINFPNSTIEQALDYLSVLTKSFWKPLSSNTIFITSDNPNKRRDYDEEVTKIFYLTNATTTQDITDMVTAVRTVADCTRLFPFQSQNAIIAKCSSDRMALTEKIIHDLDKPRAEVVIDIYVMQTSSTYIRNLNIGLATSGINIPGNFTPRAKIAAPPGTDTDGKATASTSIPFSHIGQINAGDFSTTLPNAVLQATLSDTRTKVLQSPQIRSVDGQKATMKIGERQPTASGSFQPGAGGIVGNGISPLVNTQFTYLDVGVNVEITPHVHDNNEVSLHVNLDISNVTGNKDLGGLDQPIIGQRKVEHDIRLREGEISLLSGLVNQQDSNIRSGIPGLMNIPLIGRLFSGETVDRERSELMIALVPHIVRRPEITAENLRGVASGAQQVHVSYGAKPVPPPVPPPVAPPADAANPGGAAAVLPGGAPVIVAPGAAAPGTTPPVTAPPVAAPATAPGLLPPATAPPDSAAPPAPGPAAAIHFDAQQLSKNVGDTFNVTLVVDGAKDITSAPLQITFDPKVIALNDATRGNFWVGDGKEPVFIKDWRNDTGTATMRISRPQGSPAVSGSGPLLILSFKSVASGSTTIGVSNATLLNSQGQSAGSGNPGVTVTVK